MTRSDEIKTYIVRFKGGRVNHACEPKHATLGFFSLDRVFGGGFSIVCGKPCKGPATMSKETLRANNWVTCRSCRRGLGFKKPKPDCGRVPWKEVEPMDRPRILGVPG